jgi:N-dimethylarginine dimethylaminohydrolase
MNKGANMADKFFYPDEGGVTALMCRPTYFDVRYEINPWMDRRRQPRKALAHRQWEMLYSTLAEKLGVKIELIDPVAGLPDFVFTANAGLCMGSTFIPSHFRHPQRSREEAHWQKWFEARGYDVVHLPPGLYFEGEGDVLRWSNLLVVGYRFRSDREAVFHVAQLLEKELLALELVDPWFYHLDTCFAPIGPETVLFYPSAFTEESRQAILERFSQAIPVGDEEARRLACNLVVVGRQVVMSANCPVARAELLNLGYEVHEVDVGEFMKAGGGAKCLVLFLASYPQRSLRSGPLAPAQAVAAYR